MPKKPIIIISVLCIIALALGYWSGQGKEEVASSSNIKSSEKKEPEFLKEGLVAYYPFNGNANDESGNGNDGQVNGATLVSGRNREKSVYILNGRTDYIQLPPFSNVSKEAFTALLRVKFASPIAKQKFGGYIIDIRASSEVGKTLSFSYGHEGKDVLSTGVFGGLEEGAGWCHGQRIISPGKWYLVAVSWDKETKEVITYINGNKDINQKYNSLNLGKAPFRLGGSNRGGSMLNFSIDSCFIYNRALSEAEVKALYEFEKAE